jgi:hypothetical protein
MLTFSLWLQRVRLPKFFFVVPQGNSDRILDQHVVTLDQMICSKTLDSAGVSPPQATSARLSIIPDSHACKWSSVVATSMPCLFALNDTLSKAFLSGCIE